jgi:hypothetical protein
LEAVDAYALLHLREMGFSGYFAVVSASQLYSVALIEVFDMVFYVGYLLKLAQH